MKVIVPVADKYQYLMPVFCEMFNKYWANQDCVILCFNLISEKLPDNFEIISIGNDTQYWTSNLRRYFSTFKEEYFILHLEDFIIYDYVKIDRLNVMEEEMRSGADKAMLHSHLNVFADPLHDDVMLIRQDVEYRTSLHPAIWKTDYFMRFLQEDTSAWGFEITKKSINDGAKIVTMNSQNRYHDHIVDFMNLLRSGVVDTALTGLPHEEDLEILLKIPMTQENRDNLISRTNNICPVCKNRVDRMLISDRDVMRTYEKTGKCIHCQ